MNNPMPASASSLNPPSPDVVDTADVRAVVRLLGAVAESADPHPVKKRELLTGLAGIVDADLWAWTTSVWGPTGAPVSTNMIHNVSDKGLYTRWIEGTQDPALPPPEHPYAARALASGNVLTRRRSQWIDDSVWYEDKHNKTYRFPLGFDDFVLTLYPLREQSAFSGVAFYRKLGRPAFTERDSRLIHIVLSEVDWLHYADLPSQIAQTLVPALSPRQRVVFMNMLQGFDRAEIARRLNLSVHTVNDHVKVIYRHFNVNSQAELMNRFMTGNGGDVTDCMR